jgi:hypothetical protein
VVDAPKVGCGLIRRLAQILCIGLLAAIVPATAATHYVTVAGLGGEPDYEMRFAGLAGDVEKILRGSGGDVQAHTLSGKDATRERLRAVLGKVASAAQPADALVVLLIGHGSFDGAEYKLNLPGPDITATELASLMDRIPATRQLVVNTSSSSGGAIGWLQKKGRVVITATKTGTEKNATVFARYWVEALRDTSADTDKNETVSALEAFRYADRKTSEFYETQKRLATEHPVLEDTGQGEGVRAPSTENGQGMLASAFPLVRMGAAQKAAADPAKRKLLDRKEQLESEIDRLKYEKAAMPLDEYKKKLSQYLLELAQVQEEIDK